MIWSWCTKILNIEYFPEKSLSFNALFRWVQLQWKSPKQSTTKGGTKGKNLFFHVTGSPYHFREATLMANLSCVCPTDSVAPLAAFWLEGVALPTVGGLGLIGNIATIIVLRFDYEDRWETLLRNPIWHRTSPHFYANGRYFKCHTPSFWCPWCKWQLILIKSWIKFWTW